MKKVRRWLLMLAALVGFMAHVGALRGSALYGKYTTTTTTTTTTEAPAETAPEDEATEVQPSENNTSTKSPLTGIPQIDYIWDPNLPRELNGYNLSEYPFYSSVPPMEEIDFKCGGLHDGFYASVKHKCQVYHHCLFGVRYDFLCANFTAFDQKTFICHFVSEVDCKNSPKYFHRNDALYETTTSSTTTTTPAPSTAPPLTAAPPVGPVRQRPLRRPLRRRRPQVDYYYEDEEYDDDYYEERANRRRKQRPRPRRPEYDDEYDGRSYSDDERYNKRPYGRESDEYENDRRPSDRPRSRSRPGEKRRPSGDEERPERRKNGERKRPLEERRPNSEERRPLGGERRFKPDERRSPLDERRHDRPRVPASKDDREADDFEEVRRPLTQGRRRLKERRPVYDESVETVEDPEPEKREDDVAPVVRPTGSGGSASSLFDRPRAPPKIPRPVPATERKKFEYPAKKTTTTTTTPAAEDDYYDDYEDEPAKPHDKVVPEGKGRKGEDAYDAPVRDPPARDKPVRDTTTREFPLRESTGRDPLRESPRKPPIISPQRADQKQRFDALDTPNPLNEDDYEDEEIDTRRRPYDREATRNNPKREDLGEDYEPRAPLVQREKLRKAAQESSRPYYKESSRPDEEERSRPVEPKSTRLQNDETKKSKQGDESPVRPVVRVVKRPFLPSRGGSPYLPRGLSPVGSSAQKTLVSDSSSAEKDSDLSSSRTSERNGPPAKKPVGAGDYPLPPVGSRTTQAPQPESVKSPLDDIYDNEYDVTLNDALNPTLKPLVPSRGHPSGFSHGSKFDRSRFSPQGGSFGYTSDDSAYSSTQVRRMTVESPSGVSNSRLSSSNSSNKGQTRRAQAYYDDEYDYY